MGISRTLKNSSRAYKLLLDYCGGLIWSISTPFSLNDLMTLDSLGSITQRSFHMYMPHPRIVFSFVVPLTCNLRKIEEAFCKSVYYCSSCLVWWAFCLRSHPSQNQALPDLGLSPLLLLSLLDFNILQINFLSQIKNNL